MTRSALLALVAALATTFLATPAEAQWKWKDKAGRVQYSDLPPPQGTPEGDILARPNGGAARRAASASGPAASATPAAASVPTLARTAEPELEAKRRIADQERQKQIKDLEAKVAAAKADNCARARNQMQVIDSGMRMATMNAKGEREILDDAQRAAERKRTQETIASDCR